MRQRAAAAFTGAALARLSSGHPAAGAAAGKREFAGIMADRQERPSASARGARRSKRSLGDCTYIPSAVELEWTTSPAKGNICKIADHATQVQAAYKWLEYIREKVGSNSRASPSLLANMPGRQFLSRWKCPDGHVELIEPLIGVARSRTC